MRKKFASGQFCASFLTALVIFVLFSSFGFHAVQVVHSHPGHISHGNTEAGEHGGETFAVSEYLHTANKKLLAILLLTTIALFAVNVVMIPGETLQSLTARRERWYRFCLRKRQKIRCTIQDYLQIHFSCGTLHPKLH